MPNNYLLVLYKHIIQVGKKCGVKSVGGGGHKHTIAPNQKSGWGHMPPLPPPPPPPPPPASYASDKVFSVVVLVYNKY